MPTLYSSVEEDDGLNYDDTGLLDESLTEDLTSFQMETGLPLIPTDERYD